VRTIVCLLMVVCAMSLRAAEPFQSDEAAKTLCQVAALKLVEEGRLWYDTRISWWLNPDFDHLKVVVSESDESRTFAAVTNCPTVKQFLHDTSGFPNRACIAPGSTRLRQMASVAAATPFVYRPGEKTLVSDLAYDVLAAAMEVAAKTNYEAYVTANVIGPLGLTGTTFRPDGKPAFASGSTGVWTTKEDEAKLEAMLKNDGKGANGVRILRPGTLKRYGK